MHYKITYNVPANAPFNTYPKVHCHLLGKTAFWLTKGLADKSTQALLTRAVTALGAAAQGRTVWVYTFEGLLPALRADFPDYRFRAYEDETPTEDAVRSEDVIVTIGDYSDLRVMRYAQRLYAEGFDRTPAVHVGEYSLFGVCTVAKMEVVTPAADAQKIAQRFLKHYGTVRRAGEVLGVSPSAVHRWAKGERAISPEHAAKMQQILGDL